MIRSELVAALGRDHPELNIEEVDRIVACMFEAITERLIRGGRVELRGFGSFSTRARAARTARNPRTGAKVAVHAKRALHFKPGKELRLRLNVRDERPLRRVSARKDCDVRS